MDEKLKTLLGALHFCEPGHMNKFYHKDKEVVIPLDDFQAMCVAYIELKAEIEKNA